MGIIVANFWTELNENWVGMCCIISSDEYEKMQYTQQLFI